MDTDLCAAWCVQPATDSSGMCLTFWYHMFGAHVETLNLYTVQGANRTLLWTRSNTQGNIWRQGQRTVVSKQPYKVSQSACFVPGFCSVFLSFHVFLLFWKIDDAKVCECVCVCVSVCLCVWNPRKRFLGKYRSHHTICTVTAPDMRMHHVLITLTLTF